MFDLRELIYVFIAGFVVGALFEKLGHEVKRRHDEKRGKVEKLVEKGETDVVD